MQLLLHQIVIGAGLAGLAGLAGAAEIANAGKKAAPLAIGF
ncbi:hypothetical protein [Paenibacillus sp. BK720]|nr:hypothetical protein [Paenibacillus sp. BK720]NIK71243.1 putative oxidoreductase [Paenibacillus sp. BK720]